MAGGEGQYFESIALIVPSLLSRSRDGLHKPRGNQLPDDLSG
jgi:hypothetical protein